VQLGTLPSAAAGWELQTAVNALTGEIGIDLFSSTPLQTTAAGSLVTITLHVRETAPAGSSEVTLVNQVNPTGQRNFHTEVADDQGALVLHTNLTAQGMEPGAPGQVTVANPRTTTDFDQIEQITAQMTRPLGDEPVADLASSPLRAPSGPQSLPPLNSLIIDHVFSEFAPEAQLLPDAALGQPAPVLDDQFADPATCGMPTLVLPTPPSATVGADSLADDSLKLLTHGIVCTVNSHDF
jgi:hypothetical protein